MEFSFLGCFRWTPLPHWWGRSLASGRLDGRGVSEGSCWDDCAPPPLVATYTTVSWKGEAWRICPGDAVRGPLVMAHRPAGWGFPGALLRVCWGPLVVVACVCVCAYEMGVGGGELGEGGKMRVACTSEVLGSHAGGLSACRGPKGQSGRLCFVWTCWDLYLVFCQSYGWFHCVRCCYYSPIIVDIRSYCYGIYWFIVVFIVLGLSPLHSSTSPPLSRLSCHFLPPSYSPTQLDLQSNLKKKKKKNCTYPL